MRTKILSYYNKFVSYKFVKDSIYSLISFVILAISGIIINVLIGNAYEASGLGIFNQTLALYMIFSMVSSLGLNSAVIKFSAEHKENHSELQNIFSSASFITFLFSVFFVILIIIITFFFPAIFFNSEVTKATTIICLSLPFFSQNKIFTALTNGLRHMKIYSIIQSCRWLLIILLITISILLKKEIYFIFYSFIITEVLLFSFFSFFYYKYFSFKITNNKWFKINLIFGSKSIFVSFLSESNSKIDVFFISFFLSNHHVGIYTFAAEIVKGLLSFASVLQLNINPIVSELWAKQDVSAIQKYTNKISKIMKLVMLFFLIVAAISYPIYVYLFTKDETFVESIPIFYILLVGAYLPSVYYFAGAYLTMANFLNTVLKQLIIILTFNICACIIFIYFFDLYGAAISTSLTYTFIILIINYFVKKKMKISLF